MCCLLWFLIPPLVSLDQSTSLSWLFLSLCVCEDLKQIRVAASLFTYLSAALLHMGRLAQAV